MKETKTAQFKSATLTAEFDGGKLVSLTSNKKFQLGPQDLQELYDWIGSALLGRGTAVLGVEREIPVGTGGVSTGPDASPKVQSFPAVQQPTGKVAPGYEPLEKRGKIILLAPSGTDQEVKEQARKYLANPHPTDAETVKHLLPLEKALKKEGMKLENRVINPVTVTFKAGGGDQGGEVAE